MHELHDHQEPSDSTFNPSNETQDEIILELTENELMFLSDNLSLIVQVESEDPGERIENEHHIFTTVASLESKKAIPAPRRLIEIIMHCLLEFSDAKNTTTYSSNDGVPHSHQEGSTLCARPKHVPAVLREIDLWFLREVALTTATHSGEKVGQNLTRKIAHALVGKAHNESKSSERILSTIYPLGIPTLEHLNLELHDEEASNPLIYGKPWTDEDAIIIAPTDRIETLIAIHEAVESSSTWGQFRQKVSGSIYRQAVSFSGDDHEPLPNDPLEIGGYADGDWPGFLAQEMITWVPKDAQALGEIRPTIFNGEYLLLHEADLDQILQILTLHGYQATRDETALRRAMSLQT